MFRIGLGTDTHRLEPGLPLWLGGVAVPSPVGCVAHSDGDVLLHALTDALLGAIGGGDIGEHFPDSDPRWKGQASRVFVEAAAERVRAAGYRVANVDAVVHLERVKLARYKQEIAASVRAILGVSIASPKAAVRGASDPERVNVKAKTAEGCDAVGEGRAIGAQVVVLLERSDRGG